ncbi:hypothetical protein HPB50_021924 [Hyalomma asiaticum]|uniref:Uncharacterized protein n=1 Tax=Hyalomma asiaticum TaxID=266040 RepID=A0ACB7T199_HYAAI|nr:hypothetical protein HPB50_021924 [Hyalomma asiaticum]
MNAIRTENMLKNVQPVQRSKRRAEATAGFLGNHGRWRIPRVSYLPIPFLKGGGLSKTREAPRSRKTVPLPHLRLAVENRFRLEKALAQPHRRKPTSMRLLRREIFQEVYTYCATSVRATNESVLDRAAAEIFGDQAPHSSFRQKRTNYTIRNVIMKELYRANDKVLQFATSKLLNKNLSIELLKASMQSGFLFPKHPLTTFLFACPQVSDPFYHAFDFTFREFMSPGIIACTLFALSITLTALLLVGEDQGGIRGRCAVAGLSTTEVIIGHAVVQTALAYVQTVFMLVVFVSVFDTPVHGSILVAFIIPVLMAFTGMNFGFFTSSVSKDEATALLMSMAALYPALLMGGVLWPVEGTPTVLRPISYAVPQALPVHGLRGAMLRNYTMANRQVQHAVAANVVWTVALLFLAIFTFSYTAK